MSNPILNLHVGVLSVKRSKTQNLFKAAVSVVIVLAKFLSAAK